MSELATGEIAGIISAAVVGMAAIGGGIRWLVNLRGERERWFDERLRTELVKIDARFEEERRRAQRLEDRNAKLEVVWQLLAAEVQRLDPKSSILVRCNALLIDSFPVPSGLPDEMATLLAKLGNVDRIRS